MENQKQARKAVVSARLLNTKQASTYLAISPWQLRRLASTGALPVVKLAGDSGRFRFDQRDLDAFIERQKLTLNNDL